MKTLEVIYQAKDAGTGKTVQVDVYKPDKTKDNTQSGVATEIGTTGRYYKSFDADGPGWFCEISDDAAGKAIKHWDKAAYDSHGVADAVADVQTAVTNVSSAITTLQAAVTGASAVTDSIKLDTTNILSACTALDLHLNTIESKIGNPPMIG